MTQMKSTAYKLVKNGVVIAAGSKKEMIREMKKNKGSSIWLTSAQIGDKVSK